MTVFKKIRWLYITSIPIVIIGLVYGLQKIYFKDKLLLTKATVIEVEEKIGGHGYLYDAKARFTLPSGGAKEVYVQRSSSPQEFRVGQEVNLLYSSQNSDIYIVLSRGSWWVVITILLVVFVLCQVLFYIISSFFTLGLKLISYVMRHFRDRF
jgi:hypothetical protein